MMPSEWRKSGNVDDGDDGVGNVERWLVGGADIAGSWSGMERK
jgi:hypothetical protein